MHKKEAQGCGFSFTGILLHLMQPVGQEYGVKSFKGSPTMSNNWRLSVCYLCQFYRFPCITFEQGFPSSSNGVASQVGPSIRLLGACSLVGDAITSYVAGGAGNSGAQAVLPTPLIIADGLGMRLAEMPWQGQEMKGQNRWGRNLYEHEKESPSICWRWWLNKGSPSVHYRFEDAVVSAVLTAKLAHG